MSGLQTSTARWMTVHNSTALPAQFDLPPRDPRHVQQVVDQPRLHFHVAADHLQRLAHRRVEVRPVLEHRHAHHHRRQGRAQFVAQDRQEMVLGAVGLLGDGLGAFGRVLRGRRRSVSSRFRSVMSWTRTRTQSNVPSSFLMHCAERLA